MMTFPFSWLLGFILPELLATWPSLWMKLQERTGRDIDVIFASEALHEYQFIGSINSNIFDCVVQFFHSHDDLSLK